MMAVKKKKAPVDASAVPPGHLSAEARALWTAIAGDFGLADQPEARAILTSSLVSWDRSEQARRAIEADGLVLADSRGGKKVHPAAVVERDSRAAFLAGLKALHLDLEPLRDGPGRPPGNGKGG